MAKVTYKLPTYNLRPPSLYAPSLSPHPLFLLPLFSPFFCQAQSEKEKNRTQFVNDFFYWSEQSYNN